MKLIAPLVGALVIGMMAAPSVAAVPPPSNLVPLDAANPLCPEETPDHVVWYCVKPGWTATSVEAQAPVPNGETRTICVGSVCVDLPVPEWVTITVVTTERPDPSVEYDYNLQPVVDYVCEVITGDPYCIHKVEDIALAASNPDDPVVDGVYFVLEDEGAFYLPFAG